MRPVHILIALLALAAGAVPAEGDSGAPLPVIGGVEEAVLLPWGLRVRSRIDTGAAVSSMDARSIRVRTVKGKKVVRFVLACDRDQQTPLELPLAGYRRVATPDSGSEKRPLVELEVCVAGQRVRAEFTLNDRSHMEYHMLIGRNILAGRFLVDAAAEHTTAPACPASH